MKTLQEILGYHSDEITASQLKVAEHYENETNIRSIWYDVIKGNLFICEENTGEIIEIEKDGEIKS